MRFKLRGSDDVLERRVTPRYPVKQRFLAGRTNNNLEFLNLVKGVGNRVLTIG